MEIGEIIYEEDKNGNIVVSNLENYMSVEGIWTLHGENKETGVDELLNVGKEKAIGQEILYDIACLHHLKVRSDGDKNYVNQFKKNCGFKYKSGQTQEYLYPIIASRYCSLRFVYAYDKSDGNKERELAKDSIFWRNGSPYGVKKKINLTSKRMQVIGDLFPNGGESYSIEELLYIIGNELGYDVRQGKKLIRDCLKVGFLIQMDETTFTR